jgi:hypothetical protein
VASVNRSALPPPRFIVIAQNNRRWRFVSPEDVLESDFRAPPRDIVVKPA